MMKKKETHTFILRDCDDDKNFMFSHLFAFFFSQYKTHTHTHMHSRMKCPGHEIEEKKKNDFLLLFIIFVFSFFNNNNDNWAVTDALHISSRFFSLSPPPSVSAPSSFPSAVRCTYDVHSSVRWGHNISFFWSLRSHVFSYTDFFFHFYFIFLHSLPCHCFARFLFIIFVSLWFLWSHFSYVIQWVVSVKLFMAVFIYFLDDDDDVHRCRRRHRRWRYGVRWCVRIKTYDIVPHTTLHSHVFCLFLSQQKHISISSSSSPSSNRFVPCSFILVLLLPPFTALLSATMMHVYLLSFIGWLLLLWFVGRLAIGDSFSLCCGVEVAAGDGVDVQIGNSTYWTIIKWTNCGMFCGISRNVFRIFSVFHSEKIKISFDISLK